MLSKEVFFSFCSRGCLLDLLDNVVILVDVIVVLIPLSCQFDASMLSEGTVEHAVVVSHH